MKKLLLLSLYLITFYSTVSPLTPPLVPIIPSSFNSYERSWLADALLANSPMAFQASLESSVKAAKVSVAFSMLWGTLATLFELNMFRKHGVKARLTDNPLMALAIFNFVKNAFVEGKRARRNAALAERSGELFEVLNSPAFREKWGVQDWVASANRIKRAEDWGVDVQWCALLAAVLTSKFEENGLLHNKMAILAGITAPLWVKSLVTRFIRAKDKAPDMDAVYNDALKELAKVQEQSAQ